MARELDVFVDNWIQKWSSLWVDIKVRVCNFVHPMEITVIVYADTVKNTLCKSHIKVGNTFQFRCFK